MNNKMLLVGLVAAVLIVGGFWAVSFQGQTPSETNTSLETSEEAMVPGGSESTGSAVGSPSTGMVSGEETTTFDIEATNFEFSVPEIRVKQGDTVTINFKVSEGFHDWVVDEFNAQTKQLGEGGTETITFVADKTGTFEYYCSVGQHRQMGMVGQLIVE